MSLSLILVLLLALRLLAISRGLRHFAEAVERMESVPAEGPHKNWSGAELARLVGAHNALIAEMERLSWTRAEYHDQIEALLGNLDEAVAMVDQDNRVISSNRAMKQLAGIEADSVGQRIDHLIRGTQFLEFADEVRREGRGVRRGIEARIGHAHHWLEVSAAPLTGKRRAQDSDMLLIFQDVTRRRKLERMRTEFVANVSHELRTPVTVIKGFAETLVQDGPVLPEEEKNRFLEKIIRNSERLNRLLEDLLLLSRLESAEMAIEPEVFSLKKFMEDFRQNWILDHPESRKTLILDLPEQLTIRADPLRLSQLLTNLCNNADRHASQATEIRISATGKEGGVQLSVEDNGEGIPEEDLPHIFQRFYRVDKGRSRDSGGTGLGLAIVKHIVARHAGTIRAKSKPGQGTRMEIFLPAGN